MSYSLFSYLRKTVFGHFAHFFGYVRYLGSNLMKRNSFLNLISYTFISFFTLLGIPVISCL